jgi:preprotein translocase subunit SecB
MSEDTQEAAGGNGGEAAQAGTMINVHAQYIKDLSFEVPGAPGIYGQMQDTQPDININVDVSANTLQEPAEGKAGLYEVVLDLKATCKVGEKSAFIAELTYGGVFEVAVEKDQLGPMLLIECPRLLFPFARNILADVSRDGGFPPLMLAPIDFVQLYQRRLAEQQTQQA